MNVSKDISGASYDCRCGYGWACVPALAITEGLVAKGVPVVWLGTPKGFEVAVVEQAGIPYESIEMSGLRGKGLGHLLLAPVKILKAVFQSIKVISNISRV